MCAHWSWATGSERAQTLSPGSCRLAWPPPSSPRVLAEPGARSPASEVEAGPSTPAGSEEPAALTIVGSGTRVPAKNPGWSLAGRWRGSACLSPRRAAGRPGQRRLGGRHAPVCRVFYFDNWRRMAGGPIQSESWHRPSTEVPLTPLPGEGRGGVMRLVWPTFSPPSPSPRRSRGKLSAGRSD